MARFLTLKGFTLGLLPLVAAMPQGSGGSVPHPGPGVPNKLFQLFGYGQGFGGLEVFNWNGLAYLGNSSLANDTEAAAVIFMSSSSDDTSMTGNALPGPGKSPTWSNVTYYIPSDITTSHQTGFIDGSAATDDLTTGFVFYGNTAAWEDSDGQLETKWYATPYGDTSIWALNWDPKGDSSDNKVSITLRSATPSVPPPDPPHNPGGNSPAATA